MKLKGKTALITGGGTGIGAAVAKRFVEDGAKVCVVGRRLDKLEAVIKDLPKDSGLACAGDATKREDVDRIISSVMNWSGRLDILVNNAGVTTMGALADVDPDIWIDTINVNLISAYLMMRASIPKMSKGGGGSIINIASIAGLRCPPTLSAYSVSKAGMIMLGQQAAVDYADAGIRSNAVCPGWVRTAMSEEDMDKLGASLGITKEEAFAKVASNSPLNRISDPSEIASVCAFLASDESSFMTGSVVVVDGGSTIMDAGMLAFRE